MMKLIAQLSVLALVILFFVAGQSGFFVSWGMSPPSAVTLSILLIAATLWISEAVPLFVTSFVVLIMSLLWLVPELEAAGVEVKDSDFTAPFFSNIILLFLGGFVISSALHKQHLDEQAARWVIARTGNSIPKLIAGLMAITAVLSMFLSNTATTAMMIALCLPIIQGLPKGDKYRKAILLAIPFSANVGGLGTPIGTPPNAIAIQYLEKLGDAPGFGMWMIMAMPLVLVMLIIIWAALLVVYKGESTSVTAPPAAQTAGRWSAERIIVIVTSLATVAGWLTSKFHGHSLGTVAMIPVIVFFGLKILSIKDLRGLSWDVLLVMGGGLCLGTAMAKSGLALWVIEQLPGDMGLTATMMIFGGVACLMSSLMSNTATANLIMPIVAGLGMGIASGDARFAPEGAGAILLSVAFCCSVAMALPISTPPNAIAFSSGELTVKDMLKIGLPLTILGVVLTFTLGVWWWRIVGSI